MELQWRERGGVDHELIWGLIGLLVILAAAFLPVHEALARSGYRCPFYGVTGHPCPTCGTTRAFVAAASLDLKGAFSVNPLAAAFFLGLAFCVPWALGSVVLGTRRLRVTKLGRAGRGVLRAIVVILVFSNWAYLIAADRWGPP